MPSRRRTTETGAPLARTFSSQECARSAESAGRQIPLGNEERRGVEWSGAEWGAASLEHPHWTLWILLLRDPPTGAPHREPELAHVWEEGSCKQVLMNTPGTCTCPLLRSYSIASSRCPDMQILQVWSVVLRPDLQLGEVS